MGLHVGALFLGVLAVRDLPTLPSSAFTASVWASLVFLGVLGTAVGFVWYYEGITKLGAARTVVFNNLVPIFGVLLGWLVLDESVSTSVILGAAWPLRVFFW